MILGTKKRQRLGELSFSEKNNLLMGYSKKLIMYWGVTSSIVPCPARMVNANISQTSQWALVFFVEISAFPWFSLLSHANNDQNYTAISV
jgi:hypothetical protein